MMFNFTERIELLHGIEVDTEDDESYRERIFFVQWNK